VVRDSPQPVYYVDGYYYAHTATSGTASDSWDGGWTVIEANTVPNVIVAITTRTCTTAVERFGRAPCAERPA
jgi:hypothetical protein